MHRTRANMAYAINSYPAAHRRSRPALKMRAQSPTNQPGLSGDESSDEEYDRKPLGRSIDPMHRTRASMAYAINSHPDTPCKLRPALKMRSRSPTYQLGLSGNDSDDEYDLKPHGRSISMHRTRPNMAHAINSNPAAHRGSRPALKMRAQSPTYQPELSGDDADDEYELKPLRRSLLKRNAFAGIPSHLAFKGPNKKLRPPTTGVHRPLANRFPKKLPSQAKRPRSVRNRKRRVVYYPQCFQSFSKSQIADDSKPVRWMGWPFTGFRGPWAGFVGSVLADRIPPNVRGGNPSLLATISGGGQAPNVKVEVHSDDESDDDESDESVNSYSFNF